MDGSNGTMRSTAALARTRSNDTRWSDWRWQMANRIRTVEQLSEWVEVTDDERSALEASRGRYKFEITPHYASLMDPLDPKCPIRRQAVPSSLEFESYPGADIDPVGDRVYRKTNRVVHKYPDRAILLVTQNCPVYCRHCTRKYHTTDMRGDA